MRTHLLSLFAMIISISSFSQITFEKGYFIYNSGEKIECLIKDLDQTNNPVNIIYKLSENDDEKTISLKSVKEFRIYNVSKFIRYSGPIDKSSQDVYKLSTTPQPKFEEEQLFLKVLIEGKSNLYYYSNGSLKKFFYNVDNSDVKQLVYKKYKTPDNLIKENNHFKQQLLNDLVCESISKDQISKLNYTISSLSSLFKEYNSCKNVDFVDYHTKRKKSLFNLNLRPRYNFSSLGVSNLSGSRRADFKDINSFGLGLEVEFILPFHKNKWAIIAEVVYQSFESEASNYSVYTGTLISSVDYQTIDLQAGLRHYFFLNNDSKIFANFSIQIPLSVDSLIEFKTDGGIPLDSFDFEPTLMYNFGVGYKLNDRYSLELRYLTNWDLINVSFWKSDYSNLSVIFGYTIL